MEILEKAFNKDKDNEEGVISRLKEDDVDLTNGKGKPQLVEQDYLNRQGYPMRKGYLGRQDRPGYPEEYSDSEYEDDRDEYLKEQGYPGRRDYPMRQGYPGRQD